MADGPHVQGFVRTLPGGGPAFVLAAWCKLAMVFSSIRGSSSATAAPRSPAADSAFLSGTNSRMNIQPVLRHA